MENWCYWCKQEGKDVIARVTWEGRPCCAAHRMKFVKEHGSDSPKSPADSPVTPFETTPPDPIPPQSHTAKVRTPGRLERASMTAPAIEVYPPDHFEKAFESAAHTPPDPPKKHRGRKPGSKNKPKPKLGVGPLSAPPAVAAVVNEAQKRFSDRPHNKKVDLGRLREIHADLLARRARIETIIGHLEGAIEVIGSEDLL